jgi:hypothetical protein
VSPSAKVKDSLLKINGAKLELGYLFGSSPN